jgi:hypothetical protein
VASPRRSAPRVCGATGGPCPWSANAGLIVPVAVAPSRRPKAHRSGLDEAALRAPDHHRTGRAGEYPSLPRREIVVPGASCEVAVSRDRPSAVSERVVPIHDRDRRLDLIALVLRWGRSAASSTQRSVLARWPPSACKAYEPTPEKRLGCEVGGSKAEYELNEAVG